MTTISASPFSLHGRRALVTGGSRGIGAAIVDILARQGAATAFCHLGDVARADELTARLQREGLNVGCVETNVADQSEAQRLGEWIHDRFGGLDILVNCAGIGGGAPFAELSVGDWDRMIAVHLRGAFLVSREFYSGMVERRWGRIINIASQLAFKGAPMVAHYCAAKAGLVGLTRALAHEGAPHGVLVNAVAPGPVETDLLNQMSGQWRDAKRREMPLGRFGQASEIAPTVLMLASDAGSFYVGQTLSPNGGDVML